jgi:hypothetical protein
MRRYGITVRELSEVGWQDTAVFECDAPLFVHRRNRHDFPVGRAESQLPSVRREQEPVTRCNFDPVWSARAESLRLVV